MSKSIRASVCFPPMLHRDVKVAAAMSEPPKTLIEYVAQIVESAERLSARTIKAALAAITYEPPSKHRDATEETAIRSTVRLDGPLAKRIKARADELSLSQSELIVAAVAHHLSRNGAVIQK